MAAYIDKRVLEGNAYGPMFDSMSEAMEHLKSILNIDQMKMFEQNMTIVNQLGNLTDKVTDNPTYVSSNEQDSKRDRKTIS